MADSRASLLNLYEKVKSYVWEFCGFHTKEKKERRGNEKLTCKLTSKQG